MFPETGTLSPSNRVLPNNCTCGEGAFRFRRIRTQRGWDLAICGSYFINARRVGTLAAILSPESIADQIGLDQDLPGQNLILAFESQPFMANDMAMANTLWSSLTDASEAIR